MKIQEDVADYLSNLLRKFKSEGVSVLLLLSGGSNLTYLNKIPQDVFYEKLTISTLDERYTLDKSKSNMAQIRAIDSFYKSAVSKGCQFIDTTIKNNESRDQMADRINREFLKWLINNSKGKLVITAGIGSDGHISGMKPLGEEIFTKLFNDYNPDKLVVGYNASLTDPDNPQRVTTTMNFFRRIKDISQIIVYAIGKEEALKKIIKSKGKLNNTPGRILREMENVKYFTDNPDIELKLKK